MIQGREPVQPPLFSSGVVQQPAPQAGLDPQAIMALIQRLQARPATQQPQGGNLLNLLQGKGTPRGGTFNGGVAP